MKGYNLRRILVLTTILPMLYGGRLFADQKLSAGEARQHIGEQATVCDLVAGGHYAARTRGQPTFLDFGQPYPNPVFTVLIWGEDRPKFGAPEVTFRNKRACATGTIRTYRDGRPEMIVREPSQLQLQER